MSENFRFDMIVEIGDQEVRVEHETVDQRVVIEIGAFARFLDKNSLCLWMSDPQKIVALGIALAEAGFSLGAQLGKDMDDLQRKYFLAVIAELADRVGTSEDDVGPAADEPKGGAPTPAVQGR